MKRPEQDRLIGEILTETSLTKFRQASLDHTLTQLRQRQRNKRAFHFCLLATVPILLVIAFWLTISREANPSLTAISDVPYSDPSVVAIPATKSAPVKPISKEELLALFPGRPLALIGAPGEQQLVFLDTPTPAERR